MCQTKYSNKHSLIILLNFYYIFFNTELKAILIKWYFNTNSYETSNGIRADQQGYLKNPGSQIEAQVNLWFIFHLNNQTHRAKPYMDNILKRRVNHCETNNIPSH